MQSSTHASVKKLTEEKSPDFWMSRCPDVWGFPEFRRVGLLFLESLTDSYTVWQVFWLTPIGSVFPCDYRAAQ